MPILAEIRQRHSDLTRDERANPASPDIGLMDESRGHAQDVFAPDEYGDYTATSNDVYACAHLRAKMLAKLPIGSYDRTGTLLPGAQATKLLQRPNVHYTGLKQRMQTEMSLATWGQTYLLLERGVSGMGQPREIWWAKPTQVRPVPDRTDFISRFLYFPAGGLEPIPFDTTEVIWIAYPNIIDQYTGLAPMAAARLAADVASAAMKSNRQLFTQGMISGGFVFPGDNMDMSDPDARELERKLETRFKGADKAHRWAVFRREFKLQPAGVSPADAQFVEGMNLAFRHVCRAMGVPPPLVGDAEFATLANLRVYERQLWEHTMEFEAEFIGAELTRQLAPTFGVDTIGFDLSDVVALQEDETVKWERENDQLQRGAITINEWRADQGRDPVPWGDTWWAPANVLPVTTSEAPAEPARLQMRMEFGSDEHQLRVKQREDEFRRDEQAFAEMCRDLFRRQHDAVLQKLRQRSYAATRGPEDAASEPFNLRRWVRTFREEARGLIGRIIYHGAQVAGSQVGKDVGAEILESAAIRQAIEQQTQRFAERVNQTTWDRLRKELGEGVANGETIDQLSARVDNVMGDRIRSSATTIAQTETTTGVTTGKKTAWRKLGDVVANRWVTAFDERVRDTHKALHNVVAGIDELFDVGACTAEGPGRSGCSEEDIGCRCDLDPITEERAGNGHRLINPRQLHTLMDAILVPDVQLLEAP